MLYNECRPILFKQIKGQTINKKILLNQLKENKISHGFIFYGLRGTGKTTSAKIFAKSVNCTNLQEDGEPCNECESCKSYMAGTHEDIYEIDAATYNKVDDITKIKEILNYSPIGKYKVIILDEAHMLSKAAFNALLNTLENPPKNVIIILCSTEYDKIPITIKSRCLSLVYSQIPNKDILSNLISICDQKEYKYETEGLSLITNVSEGSMRDALSNLEKCISYGDLTEENVSNVLGIVDDKNVFKIARNIVLNNTQQALKEIEELYLIGKDIYVLTRELLTAFRDINVYKCTKDESLISKKVEYVSAFDVKPNELTIAMNSFYKLLDIIKNSDNKKTILDINILQISNVFSDAKVDDIFNFSKQIKSKEIVEPVNVSIPNKTSSLKENENISKEKKNDKSKEVNNKPINYFNLLIKKIDLLRSFDINDKNLEILLKAKIFVKRDRFIIKTKDIDLLDKNLIKNKLIEICQLPIFIEFQK